MDLIDYFGACPLCSERRNDGFLNVRRLQWFVCHTHRVKWCVGENMFRAWRFESEEIWRANFEMLAEYTEVEPITQQFPD